MRKLLTFLIALAFGLSTVALAEDTIIGGGISGMFKPPGGGTSNANDILFGVAGGSGGTPPDAGWTLLNASSATNFQFIGISNSGCDPKRINRGAYIGRFELHGNTEWAVIRSDQADATEVVPLRFLRHRSRASAPRPVA